jgi:hypothetical protein
LVFITWSNCSVVMSAIPPILGHLVGRVVDQDVDAAQLLDGGVDDLLAGLLAPDIAGAADGPAALSLHQAHRLIGVGFFGLQVAEHNVGAFAGEGQGDGAADPGVRPSDHRSLAGEPTAAAVGVLAMVRLVLHGLGQPGMGLLLIGVLGLVVLLSGIGLVAHGLLGTPPFARQTLTGQRAA